MIDIDTIIAQLNSSDKGLRHELIETLGESKDKKAIGALVDVLKDEEVGIRDAAVNALINIGGKDAAQAVTPFLYEEDVSLRNIAIEVLERLGADARDIVAPLLSESDEDVLKFAIDIFSVIGSSNFSPSLIPLLHHHNPNIRASAAVALGRLKAFDAITDLIDALKNEDDEWVRFSLLEALGDLGSSEIIDRLFEAVEKGDISRIAALDALSYIAPTESVEKLVSVIEMPEIASVLSVDTVVRFIEKFNGLLDDSHKEAFLGILRGGLEKDNTEEQRIALRGMKFLKDKRAIDVLLPFAQGLKEDDEEIISILKGCLISTRDSTTIIGELHKLTSEGLEATPYFSLLAEVLGEMAEPSMVNEIQSLLNSVNKEVKKVLLKSLERIGGEVSFEVLIDLLQDEDGHVRGLAAKALRQIGSERALPALYDALLKEPYRDVQEVIGDTLSSYEAGVVEGLFITLLCKENPYLRIIGVRGLGGIETEDSKQFLETSSGQALIKALNDSDPGVRKEAVQSIGRFKNADITSFLSELLGDSEKDVRMTVLDVLGDVDGGENLLVDALKDKDMWVRFKAVNILGEKKVDVAEDAIINLLVNDEIPVKIACANVLGNRGSKEAVSVLKGLSNHSDPYLRDAVKDALERIKS